MCCSCWYWSHLYWYCCRGSSSFVLVTAIIRMSPFSISMQSSQLDFSNIFVYVRSVLSGLYFFFFFFFFSFFFFVFVVFVVAFFFQFPIPPVSSACVASYCNLLVPYRSEDRRIEPNRNEPNQMKSNLIKQNQIEQAGYVRMIGLARYFSVTILR